MLHSELTPWWSFLSADGGHHKKPHSLPIRTLWRKKQQQVAYWKNISTLDYQENTEFLWWLDYLIIYGTYICPCINTIMKLYAHKHTHVYVHIDVYKHMVITLLQCKHFMVSLWIVCFKKQSTGAPSHDSETDNLRALLQESSSSRAAGETAKMAPFNIASHIK